MKRTFASAASASLSVLYVASALAMLGAGLGCSTDLCGYVQCIGAGGAGGMASSTSSMTTTSSTMTTTSVSSSSGLPQECDPLKLMAGASIAPSCGLFVEPGAGGDGKQSAPFGTLAEALATNPMNLPIYVCSTAAAGLDEAITLAAGERLIGSLACGTWTAVGKKTPWTASQNAIPLILSQTTGALVQGFAITAVGASGSDGVTLQGNSSIGVIAAQATATLENVDITAGPGAAAGPGMNETGTAPGRQSMASSFDGKAGGGCNGAGGGAATVFPMCPAGGGPTEGGKGGDGAAGSGAGGLPGLPNFSVQEPNGTPGAGDLGTMGWTCANGMGTGENGHVGADGEPGAGGTMQGSLTTSGYAGDAGEPGKNGGIGQGGGGGGGLRGGTLGGCSAGQTGPGGGGGGAGGCGGLGGGGGGAGGASIALVSLDSTLTLTNVHLAAAAGGSGSNGGSGQLGGVGGLIGAGGGLACDGGKGGNGGIGAGGGGGKGGPSVGLAFVGTAPAIPDPNITVAMTPASGGLAGGGSVPGIEGDDGEVGIKLSF